MLWRPEKEWNEQTCYIVAGGPSIKAENLEPLRGKNTIVINSSYEALPFGRILFFTDIRWFKEHRRKPKFKRWRGRIATVSRFAAARDPRLLKLRREPEVARDIGFDARPGFVCSQRTSTQGAMNLAAHLGVNKIVLLGLDMGRGEGGVSHHHTPHPWPNKPGNKTWDIQLEQLRMIVPHLEKRGIEVINTSLQSRCNLWPKKPLIECL